MDGSLPPSAPPAAGALDAAALDRLFRSARSRNAWVDETLPEDLLRQVYELASLGPTAANSSPARYVFITSAQGKERLQPLLSEGNQKALRAPCVVACGYDLEFPQHMPRLFPHQPTAKDWFGEPGSPQRRDAAFQNATLAAAYLIVAARALGLDCGPMGGFDADGVSREFFGGTQVRAHLLVALGHGADASFPRLPRLPFDEAARFA